MSLSDRVRQRVRQRAENRCEYCLSHQDYVMGTLQVDHWLPVSRGGTDNEDNLCLACELCNQHKWAKTEAIDPETGEACPIFNPRTQDWSAHFRWSEDGAKIVGVTPCGRGTVEALLLNSPLAVTVRRNWVRAGWHPPDIAG